MSQSFDATINNAMFSMENMFRATPRHELFGSVLAFCWILGGMFGDEALFFISMVITTFIFTIGLLQRLLLRMGSIAIIHVHSFRRLVAGLLANWMYTSGKTTGSDNIEYFGFEFPIDEISRIVIAFFFMVWMITKYSENIDKNGFQLRSTPFLFVRGFLRGVIMLAALFAIVNIGINSELAFILYITYLVEPFIYYIWAKLNQSISSADMVLGDSRLPTVALRESFLSNLVLLFITISFDGVAGSEWSLLRVGYILGLVYFIFLSWEDIKKFNSNPLAATLAGEFLQNTPDALHNLDLSNQSGIVIDKEKLVDLGNSVSYKLQPGSIIIPLEETKGKVNAIIMGKTESIIKEKDKVVSEIQDGVTTVLIPAKQFKSISKEFLTKKLDTIDLKSLNLPTLDELQKLVSLFSVNAGNWIAGIKKDLQKYNLSGYGVTEKNGVTMINLPGISIIDGGDVQSVKIGPIRVLETPNAQLVKIGGFINVVEFPKLSFVSLPGITVMDVKGKGSAVDIFGFKVSDELPTEYLDEFKAVFHKYLEAMESEIDDKIGKILANNNASVALNMDWDGGFRPLLKDKRGLIRGKVALYPAEGSEAKMLPAADSASSAIESRLIDITGLNEVREKGRKRKKSKGIHIDIQLGGKGRRSKEEHKKEKISRAQRKLERLTRKEERVKAKLDEIAERLEETTASIKADSDDEEFTKITDVSYIPSEGDYEIIDEDEDENKD